MVPGTQRKAKAKRSCLRVRRIMKPGEYHKVKLRTASGGSLTIRYRKKPSLTPSCSSGESSSGEAETLNHVSGDQSFTAANGLDENQAFEDLADLPEYSQSCVSEVPSNACNVFYGCDVQPDFSSYRFWSSDDCNSSDIGSNEVLPEIPDSIDIPTANPGAMSESCFFEEPENSCAAFEETQYYAGVEQSSMLIQQLKSCSEGIEVASTLLCMEGSCEQLAANFWSVNRVESSLEDRQVIESSYLDFLGLPPFLDQTESSEIELIDLPPLLRYETGGTICLQESTALQRYEHAYENVTADCMDINSSKDVELFDENSFLLLDENLVNAGEISQSPWGAVLDQDALQEVAEQAVKEPSGAIKPEHQDGILHRKASCENLTKEQNVLVRADDSIGQLGSSLISSDTVTVRSKKLRKKRLRRATPLHTLRSLLSSRDELITSNLDDQEYPDECTLCPDVTKRFTSDHSVPASRTFIDSSPTDSTSTLRKGRSNIAHAEKVTNWRFIDPHLQLYRSIHEIHNSVSTSSDLQKKSCCTSSEDDTVNPNMAIPSSQRNLADSGKGSEIRCRSDARRPRHSSLLPEHAVATLRKWFDDHIAFPFADKEQKLGLVSQTGLTLTQVENWLSNYRHRLKVRRSDYEGNVFRPEKSLTRH